jgi:hypothetical protein
VEIKSIVASICYGDPWPWGRGHIFYFSQGASGGPIRARHPDTVLSLPVQVPFPISLVLSRPQFTL